LAATWLGGNATRRFAGPSRGRFAGPSLGRIAGVPRGRLPGAPRRRELAVVLGLLVVAGVLSAAGFSRGGGTAAPSSTDPNADAGLIAAIDSTAQPTLTPDPALLALEFSVPMPPDPTPEPTASPVPTASPATTAAPKAPTAPAVPRRFVALGDSLTAWPADPWPSRLDAIDPQLKLVKNAGIPGNVTAQMRARLSSDVLAYKPDALFVMGGTNDIAYGYSQATIIANLKAIATTAQAHGIRVFLMTIPPDSYTGMAGRIDSLNGAILSLANSLKIRAIDIHRPLTSSSGTYISRYTSDGLHFSSLGAQVVANAIYARVKPVGY
jgi:lysophospholipase L1-like esterase